MIFYNKENNLYEERDRLASDGPIIYFPMCVNSIDDLDKSILTKDLITKFKLLFNKINNQRCFSASEIAEVLNLKFNSARSLLHKLYKIELCHQCDNFVHFNKKTLASLYIINSKKQTYDQIINNSKTDITVVSNTNRHLLVTGDQNPLSTPNLHVNDNALLKAFFKLDSFPNHVRFSNVIPLSGILFKDQKSFVVNHSESFTSSITAADPTLEVADIKRLRFLYLIINLTMNYFEYHKKSFILKDHVEAICSIDRDQVLTWLMVDKNHEHWKKFVDDNLAIWANTLFSSRKLIDETWISEEQKPLFRIEKKLAHRESSKFPQIYVLRWDVEALKYILKSKGPYLLPWSVISGNDFTFLLYLDARLKWPGKHSQSQHITYDHVDLMKVFPIVSGEKQVPQSSEQFAHFIITSLREHASRFVNFIKNNSEYRFRNEDKVKFLDREGQIVGLNFVLKKRRFISKIEAWIGGIFFEFLFDGIGVNKKVYLEVSYYSKDVIRNSLPALTLTKTTNSDKEIDTKLLKKSGFYSYSPQFYYSEELSLHAEKLVEPGFDYKMIEPDSSLEDIPSNVVNIITEQHKNEELAKSGPLLNAHLDMTPAFLNADKPPVVEPSALRNVNARKFVIAKLPSGKAVTAHHHIWITITKEEPKLLLSYYSGEDDIQRTISELVSLTGDFENRIKSRVDSSHQTLQPISIGTYLIQKADMTKIFNALNSHLENHLKLNYVDQLYLLILNNKRHITRHSQSVSPIDDPVAFTSLFKHYVK
ncbi:hypothetical protein [Photobacterium sp. GB-72]|uniref:hypothetical protein n=1 Tax=Photobacterium sp. GB-72 TaxID=2022105 RepID=UPI000D15E376|nr:hypothetical protein [Photobacterium sp. GB-72]PSV27673.1 hypothetical protein C9J40_20265 [Photobacterium sp. GB-72]